MLNSESQAPGPQISAPIPLTRFLSFESRSPISESSNPTPELRPLRSGASEPNPEFLITSSESWGPSPFLRNPRTESSAPIPNSSSEPKSESSLRAPAFSPKSFRTRSSLPEEGPFDKPEHRNTEHSHRGKADSLGAVPFRAFKCSQQRPRKAEDDHLSHFDSDVE